MTRAEWVAESISQRIGMAALMRGPLRPSIGGSVMQNTHFLAQLIGLFVLIESIATLAQKRAFIAAADGIIQNRPLLFVLGSLELLAGLAMILAHNVWVGGALTIVVTILGWWLALRGALLLFLPHEAMLKLYNTIKIEKNFHIFIVVGLALGGYLTYAGFAP
jgi:hypothetical protein